MHRKDDYMKKRIIYLTGAVGLVVIGIAVILFVQSANREEAIKPLYDYIRTVELLEAKVDIVYYNVHLTSDTKWKDSEELQVKIARYAIAQCRGKASHKGAADFSVICYEDNGDVAFSWNGIEGPEQIRFYEDGEYSNDYFLSDRELEKFGHARIIGCTG